MLRVTVALAAVAAVLAADITPQQVHIAFAGRDGMRVGWKTNVQAASTCRYGLSAAALNSTATGTSTSYFPGGGYHHVVRLGGLAAGKQYFYACGNTTAPGGLTPTNSFFSAASPGTPVNALVFGDMGYLGSAERGSPLPVGGLDTNWSATVSRELMETLRTEKQFDLVWHTGDIGYSDDSFGYLNSLLNFTYEATYDGCVARRHDQCRDQYSNSPHVTLSPAHDLASVQLHGVAAERVIHAAVHGVRGQVSATLSMPVPRSVSLALAHADTHCVDRPLFSRRRPTATSPSATPLRASRTWRASACTSTTSRPSTRAGPCPGRSRPAS